MPLALRIPLLFVVFAAASPIAFAQGLIDFDSRWNYAHFLGFRPGDGIDVAVNPPRFSWPYRLSIVGGASEPLKDFTFQVDNNDDFSSPEVNVITDYNFYNTLAPFATGTWYWRVGYDDDRDGNVDDWSETKQFTISGSEPEWDRSGHASALTALSTVTGSARPRFGPAGGNWSTFKTFLESTSRGQAGLDALLVQANALVGNGYVGQDWYKDPDNYFPPTDEDGGVLDTDGAVDGKVEFDNGSGTSTWRSNEYGRVAQQLMLVCFAYKLTGDAVYEDAPGLLYKFAEFPYTATETSLSWPEYHGATTKQTVCIIEYLALLYDWFYDDLTVAERTKLREVVGQRVHQVYYEKLSWRSDTQAHNSGMGLRSGSHPYQNFFWAMPGLLIMAGEDATMDATMKSSELLPLALDFMTGVTASSLYGPDDGAINEGPGYGSEKQGTMLNTALMAEHLLDLGQEKNPFLTGYQEWHSHAVPANYQRNPFGDQWGYDINVGPNQRMLTLLTGNPHAKQRWEAVVAEEGEFLNTGTFARPWTVLLAEQKFAANSSVTATAEDKNVVFKESGWVMVGSTPPTTDAEFNSGTRMTFQSRPRGGHSHSYRSENAFAWYAHGEVLAAGGGSRRRPDAYSNHTMSHNSMLINGVGQEWIQIANPVEPYMGRLLAYEEGSLPGGGTYTHWVGDASKAYRTLSGDGLKRWHRHVIFVDETYFVIYDDLEMAELSDPAKFSWLLQVDKAEPGDVTVAADEFSWTQNDVSARVVFARDGGDLDIIHQSGDGAVEDATYVSGSGWAPDVAGNNVFDNPITGEDMLDDVLDQFDNVPGSGSFAGQQRYYFSESEYREDQRTKNSMWVTNAEDAKRWQLMSALLAWPTSDAPPVVNRLGNRRMEFQVDGVTRVISFDPTQPGDYTVSLNTYRAHAGETIPSIPTVGVSRSSGTIGENDANDVRFFINRSDNYQNSVTVNFTLSGTAILNGDYTASASSSITIPAEVSSAEVVISLADDATLEGDETIVLMIDPDAGYSIGQASTDITILDDETVNLSLIDAALEPSASQEFQLRITNPTASSQTFSLSVPALTQEYLWNSSLNHNTESYVPTFSWVDLANDPAASVAQSYTSGFDSIRAGAVSPTDLPLGFDFPFYGASHNSVTVHYKGFLVLESGYVPDPTPVYFGRQLPEDALAADAIAVMWALWRDNGGVANIYWKQLDADTFVVQWENLSSTLSVYGNDMTASFQAILRSDGSMKLQYRDYHLNGSLFGYNVALQDWGTSETDSKVLEIAYQAEYGDGSIGAGAFVPRGSDVDFAVEIWPNVDFVSLSESSINLLPGESKVVTVTLGSTGLINGDHSNTITIKDGNGDVFREVPVALEVADDLPPQDPFGLSASVISGSEVEVFWGDASSSETGFTVERSTSSGSGFASVGTAAADATSFTDTTVTNAGSTTYYYRVFASNANGDSGYSNVAAASASLPDAPSGLTTSRLDETTVLITWIDNSDNESGFLLERSTSQSSGFVAVDVALQSQVNVVSFQDLSVPDLASTVYYYRVRAINPAGNSSPSPTDSVGGDGLIMPSDGLVFYYPFDQSGSPTTVTDSSGNGNDADLTGTWSFVDGRIGNAISFGSSGYNHLDTQQNYQAVDGTGYSAAAWVYVNAFPNSDSAKLFQHHDGNSTFGRSWVNLNYDGAINTYTGGAMTTSAAGLVSEGQWHHITMSAGEGVITLYIDGVQVAQRDDTVESNVAPIRMGNHKPPNEAAKRQLNGLIDEARVYNRRLTLSEVQLLAGQSANDYPVVDAGLDGIAVLEQVVNLAGAASDPDSQPSPILTEWTQVGGPALATITDPFALDSAISFPALGDYTLRLSVDDGAVTVHDDVVFTATGSPTSVEALSTGIGKVTLQWPDADGETGYTVKMRRDGDSRWVTLSDSVAAGATEFSIDELFEGQAYEFNVAAMDGSAVRVGSTTSFTTASNPLLLHESFSGLATPLGVQNTSDGRGSWTERRDNSEPAESEVSRSHSPFVGADSPFGSVSADAMLHTVGKDSTLHFPTVNAGEAFYFSMNLKVPDLGTRGSVTMTFFNDTVATPYMNFLLAYASSGVFDLTIRAQDNTETLTSAVVTGSSHFLYGKLEASVDLKTWTLSASVTDDLSTIPPNEFWQMSQTKVYPTAKLMHANVLSFDTASNDWRVLFDEIRIGQTYTSVTRPRPLFVQQESAPHLVVIEAENFSSTDANESSDDWVRTTGFAGYSGHGMMQAGTDDGDNYFSNPEGTAPVLNYDIFFREAGTHFLLIRTREPGPPHLNDSDSLHAGINGNMPASGEYIEGVQGGSSIGIDWAWVNALNGRTTRITLEVPSPGLHTVNLWPREDGVLVDQIILTTDSSYVPTGSEVLSSIDSGPQANSPMDVWKRTHFGTAMPTGDTLDRSSLLNDGMSNLMKFAFSGTPWSAASELEPSKRIIRMGEDDYLGLSFRRRSGDGVGSSEGGYTVDNLTYVVEVSNSMQSGSWVTGPSHLVEESVISNGDGSETVEVRMLSPVDAEDRSFIRLRLE